jgi:hypothetical protein
MHFGDLHRYRDNHTDRLLQVEGLPSRLQLSETPA